MSARVLGPYSLVEVACEGAGELLVVRLTGSATLAPGSTVTVRLDPSQVLMFPRGP